MNNLFIADYGNARVRKVSFGTLPVVLTEFTAANSDNHVNIAWQTASEVNSSHFNIQRSIDGAAFRTIAKVTAAGLSSSTNHYQFADREAMSLGQSVLYYRLQCVDKNGYSRISKTVSVAFNMATQMIIYPVPVSNLLNVNLNSTMKGGALLKITDMRGTIVWQQLVQLQTGPNMFRISTASLATGSYVIAIEGGAAKYHKQFIKK
jgi:hypothetical protein